MPNSTMTSRAEFKALQKHHGQVAGTHMREMFASDKARFDAFHVQDNGILLDYSKHRINAETKRLLMDLARACELDGWRGDMFGGEIVNKSENRAVLHTALRGSADKDVEVDGENVQAFVNSTLDKIKAFTDRVRANKNITDVVNIGIGGSSLGPQMVADALAEFADGPRLHFVSNIDTAAMKPLLDTLDPVNTLFIIVSKSFTTLETMENARTAKAWASAKLGDAVIQTHFIAVTEDEAKAQSFGVISKHIFPMRKWIGGRMSVWGAAGLALALAVGFENFKKFLNGAAAMDAHFQSAPLEKNMPVIMAVLSIWYRNFFDFRAQAIVPYAHDLRKFPVWAQQLEMESNGKSVSRTGEILDYATSAVIFGGPGTDSQHAFFQALHQGTDIIPCDFILIKNADNVALNANALAQAKGLMEGSSDTAAPHRHYPGNRPSTTILMDRLDPFALGQLMALYEHKVFVQGVIWSINSFDQWGVELGKTLSTCISQVIENKDKRTSLDSSTAALAGRLRGDEG